MFVRLKISKLGQISSKLFCIDLKGSDKNFAKQYTLINL